MATSAELLASLSDIVGPGHVLTCNEAMAPYRSERRGLFTSEPQAVVRPGDTQAVAATVAACASHGAAVIPQGGNTGLVGGSVAHQRHAIVLSLERLSRIRTVDAMNRTLTAEAGCPLAAVQSAAAEVDRLFPLSYAAESACQLGGNLATNAGGMNVLRYGNARELTLGLEVVLADGRIWDGLTGLRKDNAGYDLRNLFIGSEGTLGIITAAVMRLFPRPRQTVTAVVALDEPDHAVALLHGLQAATGEAISAFELMSRFSITMAWRHGEGCDEPFTQSAPWYVVLDAATTQASDDLADRLGSTLDQHRRDGQVREWHLGSTPDERAALWRPRNQIPAAQRHEGASIKHDIAVPVSRVPEFLRRADQLAVDYMTGIRPCAFGHVGDGNIHYNLSQPEGMTAEAFLAHWQPLTERIHDLVVAMGGSFAAEHGIGRLKSGEVQRLKTPVETDMMGAIKGVLDPDNVLNPGAMTAPRGGYEALGSR